MIYQFLFRGTISINSHTFTFVPWFVLPAFKPFFLPTIPQIKFQMIVGAKKGYNIRPWGPGRPVLNIEEAAAYGRVYIKRNYIHVNKHLTPFTRNSTNFTCIWTLLSTIVIKPCKIIPTYLKITSSPKLIISVVEFWVI